MSIDTQRAFKVLIRRHQLAVASLIFLVFVVACGGGSSDGGGSSGGDSELLGAPELIETNPGSTSGARVAVAQDGSAIVVWSQTDGAAESLWANRYEASIGWGTPELIDNGEGRLPSPDIFREHLSLAMAPDGNAIVVWTLVQDETNDISTWSNQYVPSAGWGTPERIEQNDGWTAFPQIAMDTGGNAIAVWRQVDGSGYGLIHSIWANRFESGSGWGIPELLENEPDTIVNGPRIAINSTGQAIAVWQQHKDGDGGGYNAWANLYEPGIGWGTPALLETETGSVWAPRAGVDAEGNAIVTWMQSDGIFTNLLAVRYEVGTGWGLPEMIEANPGHVDSFGYSLAIRPNGEAVSLWSQSDGSEQRIWANHFEPDTGWGNPSLVETSPEDTGTNTINTDVDFSPNGEAVAVWSMSDVDYISIWTSRSVAGVDWDTPKLLEENEGNANNPQLSIDSDGNIIAVWSQWDGAQDSLWAYRFR
jgi:hypothetical protein